MELSELKLALIQKITDCNDLETLMKIDEILNNENKFSNLIKEPSTVYQKTEQVFEFNEWQQSKVDIALKQINEGEFSSNEATSKEMEKWFKAEEKRFSGQ